MSRDMEDARFVGPHERLLFLRSLPEVLVFDVDFQMDFALRLRERYFRRGTLLAAEGEPPRHVHFLVEGEVRLSRNGTELMTVEPPYAVGFLHSLAQTGKSVEIRATDDTLTLSLGVDELWVFLEDHFPFLRTAFRSSARQLAEAQHELERMGAMRRDEAVPGPPAPEERLDLVQRIEILTRSGPYADAALDAIVDLARGATEVRVDAGEHLWTEGDHADFGSHILSGVVRCRDASGAVDFRLGAGAVIGHLDAFGEISRRYDAVAETPLQLLRMETDAIFDVLEEEFALARSFLGFMNRMVTDLLERLAVLRRERGATAAQ